MMPMMGIFHRAVREGAVWGWGDSGCPPAPILHPSTVGRMLEPCLPASSLPASEDVSQAWSWPSRILPAASRTIPIVGWGQGWGWGQRLSCPLRHPLCQPCCSPSTQAPSPLPLGSLCAVSTSDWFRDPLCSAKDGKGQEETFRQSLQWSHGLAWLCLCRGELFIWGNQG